MFSDCAYRLPLRHLELSFTVNGLSPEERPVARLKLARSARGAACRTTPWEGSCPTSSETTWNRESGREEGMQTTIQTRELYHSANGDRWYLARDPASERVFIKHEANLPSGGHVADIEIGTFLKSSGLGPEHRELLLLIGTLVDEAADTQETAKDDRRA
jgi:hypothetical protein